MIGQRHRAMELAILILAIGGFAVASPSQSEPAPSVMTYGYVDANDVVSIEVNGDDVTVLLNGEDMPSDRYSARGRAWHIKDEHGRPVAILQLSKSGGTLRTLPRRPHRMRLGVTFVPVRGALAEHLELEEGQAVQVTGVEEGGAADKAGLHKHDVITRIDGESPATKTRLAGVLSTKKPGDVVQLRIVRKGQTEHVEVTLEASDLGALGFYDVLGDAALSYDLLGSYGVGSAMPNDLTLEGQVLDLTTPQLLSTAALDKRLKSVYDVTPYLYATRLRTGTSDKEEQADEKESNLAPELRSLEKRLAALERLLEGLDKKLK